MERDADFVKIWGLHGFLGRPQDFSSLKLDLTAPDYLRIPQLSPKVPLKQWGENFCSYVGGSDNFLIGYSQGGRLALHALKARPEMWTGLVLISANPGIPETEKANRLKNDQHWADRFTKDDFQKTLRDWNHQAVFVGSNQEPQRNEEDYLREDLANCLVNWSVARQENFREYLKSVKVPMLYLCGDKDQKYISIGEELEKLNSEIKKTVIGNSGHRLIFDNPEATRDEILHARGLRDFFARYKGSRV